MKYKDVESYLKDVNGNPSSTRLFSYILLKFFIWFNILVIPVLVFLVYILKESSQSFDVLLGVGMIYIVLNVIFGIMIFAPKQFSKISELRTLVELAKEGKDKTEVTNIKK